MPTTLVSQPSATGDARSKSRTAGRTGGITDIVDRETGFISEVELGRVAEDLSEQMNAIAMLKRQAEAGDGA